MNRPGRTCPSAYGYPPEAFACVPELHADTLLIAGGLYGNPFALQALLDAYDAERGAKALVFNGDFHWFDVDRGDFARINQGVLAFPAIRGNVETELAAPGSGAGCGCAYPDWVDEGVVQRSNRIIERLRATAGMLPQARAALAALPMHLVAQVGDARIAIVHGDAGSLAGWGFSQEALGSAAGLAAAEEAFERCRVDVFASSHTCLPVLQSLVGGQVIVNNGAAGMPNFRGAPYGLATRIALTPARDSVFGLRRGALFIDAVPLRYDATAWSRRFLEQWPRGSDAHRSYWRRIVDGPDYTPQAALRLRSAAQPA